jgi:hypothetical protein
MPEGNDNSIVRRLPTRRITDVVAWLPCRRNGYCRLAVQPFGPTGASHWPTVIMRGVTLRCGACVASPPMAAAFAQWLANVTGKKIMIFTPEWGAVNVGEQP